MSIQSRAALPARCGELAAGVKLTSWILLVLALVILGALGGGLLSGGQGEPRDLLESALRRFNGPEQDTEATLQELDLALRSAEGGGDGELAADILIARGRVLRQVGAFGPARADLERALERYRPGAMDIELELVALEEETGELADALERAKRITDRDPAQLEAWTRSGQILMRMSDERLHELEELCDANLPDDQALLALGYARRAAGMDADDPLRVSQLAGLRSLFNPPDQSDSLRAQALVDAASSATARAREALVRSFAGPLDRDAVYSYLELLARSGRTRDAVDFGLAVVPQRAANSSPKFMERLARVLIDTGRPNRAGEVIQSKYNRNSQPGQAYYATWCEALYKAGRWRELLFVADRMRDAGSAEYISRAMFYMGLAQARMNQPVPAGKALELYVRREPVEPFPGALALAWRTLATSYRTQGELAKESAALRESVRLEPKADGEAWLRLFQIRQETDPQALDEAEKFLTHAMCLLPLRTGELMPIWQDVGKRRLRASGTELELLLADQRKQGRAGPAPEAGPYELFRFAQMHRDAREPVAAAACARRLLLAYPGFLPAMDLMAEAQKDMGDWRNAARTWIDMLVHAGPDPETLRQISRLPPQTLDASLRIELMQLDPENTGRLEVARTFQAEGRPLAALAGLNALPLEPLGDDGVLLASELMIEVGRYPDALAMLAKLTPGRREGAHAFELALDAATLSGDEARLLGIIANPPKEGRLIAVDLVPRVDLMLARGQIAAARALLEMLDSRPVTRNRDVLLRKAAIAMLARDSVAAQDELDRAEAFDAGSAVAFGRLLAVLESRVYNRVPIFVRGLFDTSFQPTRLQLAILSILDERLDEARRLIAESRGRDSSDPAWALLAASLEVLQGRTPDVSDLVDESAEPDTLFTLRGGGQQRDPRPLYARLLALDSPDWRHWAIADSSQQKQPQAGSLWASFLVGRGLAAARMPKDAERAWRSLLRIWPTFEPAWDALEKIKLERVKRFDHIEMVRLRADRRQAVGRRPGEEAEELLTEAWSREAAGNLSGALESVRRAVELDPELAPAWFKLGQLSHRVPDWNEAITALRRASRICEVESASPIVEEFLAVLRAARAAQSQSVPASLVRSDLAELALRFRDDPAVALAQAGMELDQEDIAPAVRVARAYELLDRFREHIEDLAHATNASATSQQAAAVGTRAGDPSDEGLAGTRADPLDSRRPQAPAPTTSLESLRAGSTGAWKDFYQGLEPARAEAFVRRELEQRPGSLELWRMLGETLQAQGRRSDAITLFELVARMVPDGPTHRALARLYAEAGAETRLVEAAIAAVLKLEGRAALDLDLSYDLALAQASSEAGLAPSLQVLANLWQQRDAAIGKVTEVDIGQLYGTTLVQRADPADRLLASNLLAEVAAAIHSDPARKNLVEALGYLAAQIPPRVR